MFPVTITLQNPAQLSAVLAALQIGAGAALPETVITNTGQTLKAATEAPTAGKPAKASDAPGPTTATKAAAPAKTAAASTPAADGAAAESQASTAATELTYDVVGKAITEKAKTDRAHVIATLEQFGVKKGPELKPEQYADFMKALG